ncbi:interleukin-8-like [Amphiprion ocellaris]|uniref:Chemokine interleukin-8-like domain-containing protein n=1 Tax=Amphiprion percula TaxID=161767 RepID=A0A3P8TV77_AMPPE|nr:interleukin-8-like [Amphiprion ocellaris]
MSTITTVALLVLLIIHEGISVGGPEISPRCQCITTEKRKIGRLIGEVEVRPANSHCTEIEIIATLKKDGQKICLDPDAPWVKKVLANRPAVQTT